MAFFGVYVRGGDDNLACNKSFLRSVYLSKPQMNRCLLILNILVWHMEAKFGRSDAELHLYHPTNTGGCAPPRQGQFHLATHKPDTTRHLKQKRVSIIHKSAQIHYKKCCSSQKIVYLLCLGCFEQKQKA